MDKNIIIQNLNNNILYQLKPSRIDGIGIHSITDIKENTVIIRNNALNVEIVSPRFIKKR